MRHLPTPRLAVYVFPVYKSQFAPQKAQEQENQLRNQLKQNYMQIVSSNSVVSLLFIEASVLVWLPEAAAGAGSGEEKFFHQTTDRHRYGCCSREKRESIHNSLYKRGS